MFGHPTGDRMNRLELESILPHRGRMLLLDKAEVLGETAHGTLTIQGDEFFLDGHFPGNPIVPGVILCEVLAQSACVLLQGVGGKTTLYTGLSKVKFRHPVRPGDTFETQVKLLRSMGNFYWAQGEGYVGDTLCISAEFSFAIQE